MDQITEQEKYQRVNQMASLQSGSPDSYQKRAMEQNLAAEKFIQNLEISEQRKSQRHQGSIGSVQDAVMEEQTISRYLVKGESPSLGGDTMQRTKTNNGIAETTDGRRGFQGRKSGGLSPDSYPGFALQNIESSQIQGSAEFNVASGHQQAPNEVHSFDNRQTSSFNNLPNVATGGSFARGQKEFEQEIQKQNQIQAKQSREVKQVPVLYRRQDQNEHNQNQVEQRVSPLLSPPMIDASASRPLRSKSPDTGANRNPQYQPGDTSQDMSMALNDRIQKLKNDLKGTTSTNIDVEKRGDNQADYQVNIQSPGSFANTQSLASRDLRYQIMRQTDQADQVLSRSRSRSPVLSPSNARYELEAERLRLENEYQVQIHRSRSREDSRSSPLIRAPPLRVKNRGQFPSGASPQSNMLIRDSTNSNPSIMGNMRNLSADKTPITDTNLPISSARGRSNSAFQKNSRLASRRTASGSGIRTAGNSQLRKKPSLSSIQNELQAIQIKQVKFQNEQNLSPNIPQDAVPLMKPPLQSAQDSLNLDRFYQDLIKKERMEFEKVLKSKLCIERAETTKKMRKQIQKASEKLEKVSELEKHLKYAKNNNERLRIEWEAMKTQLTQSEKTLSIQVQENQLLRNKLDALWDKYEEEKDIVMLVTKNEVEKVKQQELEALHLKLNAAQEHNEHLTSRVSHMATIQEENQESIAERSKLLAEKDVLESKVDRLELENKRLKDELEKTQEAQMAELRQKYEQMKMKYAQMASSSSQLKQLLVEGRESSIRPHTNSALDGSLNGQYQSQPLLSSGQNLAQSEIPDILKGTEGINTLTQLGRHSNINETRSNRSKSKTRAQNRISSTSKDLIPPSSQQVRATLGKPNDSAEVWRLRCKLLAEKYFNIIRDLKLQLQAVKEDAQRNIQETRKELGNQLMLELKKYILKLDQRVVEGRDMKNAAKEFIETQNLSLQEFDYQLDREGPKHQRRGVTQRLGGPELVTPAFQSNQNPPHEKAGHSATQIFSSDAFGLGGLTEDYNGRFGISPQADQLNLYSAASSSQIRRAIDERPASMSPIRVYHEVHQTDISGYQSVPQNQAPYDPRMLSQYGRSYSKPRVMPPNNPVDNPLVRVDRSTDSQPFYVKNTILRNESMLVNDELKYHQPSTNSQISPNYNPPRPIHLLGQASISKASRLSSNSRDRPVEQVGYINGQPHRMAALRSKSPTVTNHSYTSQKIMGSVIEKSERDIPNDYIHMNRERDNSISRFGDSLSAKNHAAHQEIMQALHQQPNVATTTQLSRGSRNESQNQPVSFQQQQSFQTANESAFQQPMFQNQAIHNSQSNLNRGEMSQERNEKQTILKAGIQSSKKQGFSGNQHKTFQSQQTSNKSIKQNIRDNIRSQRRLDFNRVSSIKSRQSSNGSKGNDNQITSNAQLEGGVFSNSRESIEASKKTISRKSRFEQYSQKDSYDRYSQRSKSLRSTLSNQINGNNSGSRDSHKIQTQPASDKFGLPYENMSSSAAQDTKQIQLNRIISPTNVRKTNIVEYENYNQDIQDVANSAASFRHLTGNENSQFMVSIDTDKVLQGSQQFAKTGSQPEMHLIVQNSDPSGGTSNLKTTWNRTGQFSGQLQGVENKPEYSAIVSVEQDPRVQNALDQNLNTFEDLDAQIQKSIASLKKMGGQSSKNSSIERNESVQTGQSNKYKKRKNSGAKGSQGSKRASIHGSSQGQPPFK